MRNKIKEWSELIGLNVNDIDIEGITDEETAAALLILMVHKGYNDKVWGSKRKRYWNAFQEKLELALGASDLDEFISLFAREMNATVGCNKRHRQIAVEITWSVNATEVFEHIRIGYEMLVTLARVFQEILKDKYQEEDEE